MKYPFEKLFLVCTGPRCNDIRRGEDRGELIRDGLKAHNGQLGRKLSVRICGVSCLDLCEHGPNMIAEPDGTTYTHLDLRRALAAYAGEVGDGPKRHDLELDQEELRQIRAPKSKE